MRRMVWGCALTLGVFLFACTGTATPDPEPEPKPERPKSGKGRAGWAEEDALKAVTVHQGAVQRTAWVHVPRVADGKPTALVVVFHHRSGDAQKIAAWFEDFYDRDVVFAFPEGKIDEDDETLWDGIGRGPNSLEDVEFAKALADQLRREHDLPDDRMFAAGYSAGGFMTLQLACHAADVYDGFAVVGQSMVRPLSRRCPAKGGPNPILFIAGTSDPKVPWKGRKDILGVMDAVGVWQDRNDCDSRVAEVDALPDADPSDRVRVERQTWTCEGAPVELLKASGGGHPWPHPKAKGKRATRDIDAAAEIMAFFGLDGSEDGAAEEG